MSISGFAETDLDDSDDEDKLAKRVYENSEPRTLLELLKHPKERSYVGRVNEPHPHILSKWWTWQLGVVLVGMSLNKSVPLCLADCTLVIERESNAHNKHNRRSSALEC